MDTEGRYHTPVLLDEVVEAFAGIGSGEILDGTVGGGGHSRALLERYPECRILAVDRDPEALAEARSVLEPFGARVRFVKARFDEAAERVGVAGPTLDGVLLDLGVSSHQLDAPRRGFTFREEGPLDMRMGGEGEGVTAADLLNEMEEEELARVFRRWGEEPRGRRLAGAVVRRRESSPFRTTGELVEVMTGAYGRPPLSKEKARVFQALRIAVNGELEALERALPAFRDALRPGGVFVVISYHSLEDREVKNAFRDWSTACTCPPELPVCICGGEPMGRLEVRGIIRPTDEEVERNPRARSARMRVWRKAA